MPSAICPGVLSTGLNGEALCSVAWVEAASSFDAVDLEQAGTYFASGFTFIAVAWVVGKGVALVLDFIRR